MKKLNKYQIIQIILLVAVAMLVIAFTIKAVKANKLKNKANNQSVLASTEVAQENNVNEITPVVTDMEEEVQEIEGDTSWDEEDVEDTKVDVEEEEKKGKEGKTDYYIKVNYTANCVTVYKKDASGEYTIPVKALICSTGTATPTGGVYKTSNKYRWHQLNGGVYGQYCTRITGHILFHSVPCASNTPDSLKYVAYDKLGTRASAGCVRLTVEGALWLYNNCSSGTYVEFYSSSNPGPLGKPSAKKISSNVACRNWDPTDPDPRNPWHSYVEPSSEKNEEPAKIVNPETPTPVQPDPVVEPQENSNENNEISEKENSNSQNQTQQETQNTNTDTNTNTNTNSENSSTENKTTNSETVEKDNDDNVNNTSKENVNGV